tara:strand:+ start:382 stop:912 length:531 start_codon:yes stop_codon:yes gene_type:complete
MKENRRVKIPIETVKSILSPMFVKSIRDKSFVIDAFMSMITDNDIELLLELINRDSFKVLSQRDYVKFKPSNSIIDRFDIDLLEDAGLYKDGYMFGRLIDDSSWSSDFNPYYPSMKIGIFNHGKNIEDAMNDSDPFQINTMNIEPISKDSIPYFKLRDNVKEVLTKIENNEIEMAK